MDSPGQFAFLLPIMLFLFGGAMLVLARWSGSTAIVWGAALILAGAGFTVPVLPLPGPAKAVIANALFMLALLGYGQALLLRLRRPVQLAARAAFAAAAYAAIAYAALILGSLDTELALSDMATTILLLWPVGAGLRHARRPADWGVVVALTLIACESLIRVLVMPWLVTAGSGPDAYTGSTYYFVSQASSGIIAMFLVLAALASEISGMVTRFRDESERDALTGLLNRRGLDNAARGKAFETQPVAVVHCDIDHFKRVNDRFGHAAGDEVLKRLAALIERMAPADALSARFGGEEFVILLPGMTMAEAAGLAQRIRAGLAAESWNGMDETVTASFGVSQCAPSDHGFGDAINRADAALYSAKAEGRNRVVLESGANFAPRPRLATSNEAGAASSAPERRLPGTGTGR